MLRRRGVYFSLMTLALSALGFTVAFRWTAVTGGENGLGGIERPVIFGVDFNDNMAFYVLVAGIVLAVAALMWRFVNAPLGRVLEAIRDSGEISDDTEAKLKAELERFVGVFAVEEEKALAG